MKNLFVDITDDCWLLRSVHFRLFLKLDQRDFLHEHSVNQMIYTLCGQTSHYNINHNVNGDDVDDELALTVDASGFDMDQWTSPTHEWIMYRACAQNNRYSQRTMILFIDVTRVKYIRLISILVWPLCQQHKSKSASEWNDMKKYWLLLLINFWYLKIE